MADELGTTYQAVKNMRAQLLAGKLFKTLPHDLGTLIDGLTPQPATPLVIPADDIAALGRLHTIETRIKQSKHPAVTDAELAFMIDHLASLSPAVRDKGVFFLINDILQLEALNKDQLVWLVKRLQAPDFMFAHILEPQNDGIFLRSFAVMILSGLVYADQNSYHALSAADYDELVLQLATYIVLERDGRGYVDPHGWAHSYTHIGNLLDELTSVATLARGQKVFLMAAVIAGWQRMADPLVYGEDQRIAIYLTNLTTRHQFYAESLVMCLTEWQQRILNVKPRESASFWNQWYNRSRLLTALLMRADLPKSVTDYIQKIIDLY